MRTTAVTTALEGVETGADERGCKVSFGPLGGHKSVTYAGHFS
jgi:hypothetical protein